MTKAHIESLFLHVTQDNFKANVGVVYRPPNSSINDFKDDIQNLIKTLPKTNVTYILGDFNLDLHKSAMNPIVDTFEQFFISEGLFPLVSIATHRSKATYSKPCIDNFFLIE